MNEIKKITTEYTSNVISEIRELLNTSRNNIAVKVNTELL